jgi:large subunit ribosomal protein L7/L12
METKEAKVELTEKMKSVMETIEKMTVMELADLVKALEDKFGVVAAAPAAAAGSGAAASGAAPAAAEEKSVFTVVLANAGASKIQVIKELRTITSLGLKEAKDLVDGAPKTIKEGATKDEADKIKKQLEAAGAKIELK